MRRIRAAGLLLSGFLPVVAGSAGAVTLTYTGVREVLESSASAEAAGGPTAHDAQADTASANSYSNYLDSTVLDQNLATGASSLASAGADLAVELSPTSTLTSPYAIWVDGGVGFAIQGYGGAVRGDGDAFSNGELNFTVDQAINYTVTAYIDAGGDGSIRSFAWFGDAAGWIVQLDVLGVGPGPQSIGLSGTLQPGVVYTVQAGAQILDARLLGDGAIAGAGRFHLDILLHTFPLPEPSAATLLLASLAPYAAARSRRRRR